MTASRRLPAKPRLRRQIRRAARRAPSTTTTPAADAPLLHLQAHWGTPAHPCYLQAAAFHWPQ